MSVVHYERTQNTVRGVGGGGGGACEQNGPLAVCVGQETILRVLLYLGVLLNNQE